MGKGGCSSLGVCLKSHIQPDFSQFSEGLRFNHPHSKPVVFTLKVNLYILVTFLKLGFVNPCSYYLTLLAHAEPNTLHKI